MVRLQVLGASVELVESSCFLHATSRGRHRQCTSRKSNALSFQFYSFSILNS